MADDDVRLEAELLQIGGGVRDDVGASHGPVQFARRDVGFLRRAVGFGIRHLPHAGNLVRVGLGQEHHVMLSRRDQMSDDVQVLSGEVLVDEQVFHTATWQGGGRFGG